MNLRKDHYHNGLIEEYTLVYSSIPRSSKINDCEDVICTVVIFLLCLCISGCVGLFVLYRQQSTILNDITLNKQTLTSRKEGAVD